MSVGALQNVDAAAIARTRAKAGIELRPDELFVSYVQLCEFRGHAVPHLIIQTARGPVTVAIDRPQAQRTLV